MRAIKVRTAGTFAGPQAQPLQRKNGQVAAALRNSHPPDQWPYSTPSPVTLPAITANSCQNQSAPRRYGPCQTKELDRQLPEYVASMASQLRVQNHHGDSPHFMSPVFWTTAIILRVLSDVTRTILLRHTGLRFGSSINAPGLFTMQNGNYDEAKCRSRPIVLFEPENTDSRNPCQRKTLDTDCGCLSAIDKAERQGFEPWVPLRVLRFSRPVRSAALPSLRGECY